MDKFDNDMLLIDQHALDRELIRQAHTYHEIAIAYAEAVSKRDAAYENIKTVDANLYFHLRQTYEAEGTKITESLLSQKVLTHPEHTRAHGEHNLLKLEADKLMALKDAFGQRSYMLRDMVQLYTTGYFTENSVSGKESVASDIGYLHNRTLIAVDKKAGATEDNILTRRRNLRTPQEN